MSKKYLFVLAGTLAVLGTAGLGMYANAYSGNFGQHMPWFSQERHNAMQNAFENNDYNSWKSLMGERMNAKRDWMESKITPKNFARFAEMHRLIREGKIDEANAIREELGLPMRGGRGCGGQRGNNQ